MVTPGERLLINAGSSGAGWSSIEPFMRCMQLGAYKRELGIDFPKTIPLVRGSIGHAGLAHHYQRIIEKKAGRDPDAYYDPFEAMKLVAATPEMQPLGPQLLPLCERIVGSYIEQHAVEKLDVVAVEHFVETQIPTKYGPQRYTARLDLIVRDRNARFQIWDHKLTSNTDPHKSVWRYTLSGQFLGFQLFGRMLFGDKFNGTRVNLLGAIEHSGKKGPAFTFEREAPEPAWNAVSCFVDNLRSAFERREELRRSGLDPWRWPKALSEQACVTPYGKCDGYELCQYGESALVTIGAGKALASSLKLSTGVL